MSVSTTVKNFISGRAGQGAGALEAAHAAAATARQAEIDKAQGGPGGCHLSLSLTLSRPVSLKFGVAPVPPRGLREQCARVRQGPATTQAASARANVAYAPGCRNRWQLLGVVFAGACRAAGRAIPVSVRRGWDGRQ